MVFEQIEDLEVDSDAFPDVAHTEIEPLRQRIVVVDVVMQVQLVLVGAFEGLAKVAALELRVEKDRVFSYRVQ